MLSSDIDKMDIIPTLQIGNQVRKVMYFPMGINLYVF